MRKRILFIFSILAFLMYPLSLSAQDSTAGDQALTPDFDGDGHVSFSDFLAFVSHFGSRQGDEKYEARFDLDSDGAIEFSDFLIFISSFGRDVSSPSVDIPDANLRAVIAKSLGRGSDETITQGEMATLTRLEAPNANIRDLTGLEFATHLTRLDLGVARMAWRYVNSNRISDLSPLSGLDSLERLYLSENRISDLSPLSGLTSLEVLGLSENSISEVSALSDLTKLEVLGLAGNSISDLSPLSGLDSLEVLGLAGNSISEVSALSGLTSLEWLGLSENSISDIMPLSGLDSLEVLGLSENSISDITPLSGLTSLRWLWLDSNNISDLSPLVANTGLGHGDVIDVRSNPLSDTSINKHIPDLQSAGVEVRSRSRSSKPAVEKEEQDIFREMMELLRIEESQAGDYIYRRWEKKDGISSK